MIGSSILISLLTFLSALISFFNQLVLAKLFGASMSMDAYLIAISVPLFVSGVLVAVISYSLVPVLISHKLDYVIYRRFSGFLLISFIFISVAIAFAGSTFAVKQISFLGESLSEAARQDAILMARISWVSAALTIIMGLLNAMHNADKSFLLPVVASILPFTGMLAGAVLFGSTHGPVVVAWGMLAGVVVAIPILIIRMLPALDLSAHCVMLWKDVTGYLLHMPLIIVAMLCFTTYQLIDAYWAPQVGTGNLAYLGYSHRILIAIGSLVIAGPSAVLLPRLSEAFADGRVSDLLHDAGRMVRAVVALAMPITIFVSIMATPLVGLIFERGAFNHQVTQGVGAILPFMMVGMLAMVGVVIIFRALFSKHDITRASLLGVLATVLYFVLSGLLIERFGVKGIALAYAISWWFLLLFSALSLWRGYFWMLLSKENFAFFVQLTLVSAITSVIVTIGKLWIGETWTKDWVLLIQLSVIGISAIVVYFTVAIRILRMESISLVYYFIYSKVAAFLMLIEKRYEHSKKQNKILL